MFNNLHLTICASVHVNYNKKKLVNSLCAGRLFKKCMIFNFLNLENSLRNNKADRVSKCFAIHMLQKYSQLTNQFSIYSNVFFYVSNVDSFNRFSWFTPTMVVGPNSFTTPCAFHARTHHKLSQPWWLVPTLSPHLMRSALGPTTNMQKGVKASGPTRQIS